MTDSTVSGNTAHRGGGIHHSGNEESTSTLTLNNSTVHSNTANNDGGGIHHSGHGGSTSRLSVSGSNVHSNRAHRGGGGIHHSGHEESTSTITVSGSTVHSNRANNDGGGIHHSGNGGSTSTITVTDSTVSGNTAHRGGGIHHSGNEESTSTLTLNNSTVHSNTANNHGGGIHHHVNGESTSTLTVTDSNVHGNRANNDGGGIHHSGNAANASTLTLNNSTVSGNTAHRGGGIHHHGNGPSASTLTLNNSTVSGNTANNHGGGIHHSGNAANAVAVTVGNSIIADNSAPTNPDVGRTGSGNNLIGIDTLGAFTTNFTSVLQSVLEELPESGLEESACTTALPVVIDSTGEEEEIVEEIEIEIQRNQDCQVVVSENSSIESTLLSPKYNYSTELPDSTSFPIERINVEGSTVFTSADFAPLIEPYSGENVTLNQLQGVADAIIQLYREQGYINSRALLTEEAITDGVATIEVIEGTITTTSFPIERINVEGSTIFTSADFAPLIEPYSGENVTLNQLQGVADAIIQLYREEGYINSRALLTEEAITDGVATIEVIEGTITTTSFPIERINVEGSTIFTPADFAHLIEPYSGENVTLNQLQGVADAIIQLYREEGYINSRALITEKAISDGVATIEVIEGTINHSPPPKDINESLAVPALW